MYEYRTVSGWDLEELEKEINEAAKERFTIDRIVEYKGELVIFMVRVLEELL